MRLPQTEAEPSASTASDFDAVLALAPDSASSPDGSAPFGPAPKAEAKLPAEVPPNERPILTAHHPHLATLTFEPSLDVSRAAAEVANSNDPVEAEGKSDVLAPSVELDAETVADFSADDSIAIIPSAAALPPTPAFAGSIHAPNPPRSSTPNFHPDHLKPAAPQRDTKTESVSLEVSDSRDAKKYLPASMPQTLRVESGELESSPLPFRKGEGNPLAKDGLMPQASRTREVAASGTEAPPSKFDRVGTFANSDNSAQSAMLNSFTANPTLLPVLATAESLSTLREATRWLTKSEERSPDPHSAPPVSVTQTKLRAAESLPVAGRDERVKAAHFGRVPAAIHQLERNSAHVLWASPGGKSSPPQTWDLPTTSIRPQPLSKVSLTLIRAASVQSGQPDERFRPLRQQTDPVPRNFAHIDSREANRVRAQFGVAESQTHGDNDASKAVDVTSYPTNQPERSAQPFEVWPLAASAPSRPPEIPPQSTMQPLPQSVLSSQIQRVHLDAVLSSPAMAAPDIAGRALPKGFTTNLTRTVIETGRARAELILEPAELGRLRFDIVTHGDRVQINLAVERPETLSLLRNHVDDLRQEFRDAGFTAGDLNFSQWGQQDKGNALANWVEEGEAFDELPIPIAPISAFRPRTESDGLDLRL